MSKQIGRLSSQAKVTVVRDRKRLVHHLIGLAQKSLAIVLSALLFLQPAIANAQSVSAAGSAPAANQPGVGAAPNGVPLIDIVTPNGAGLSHNKYDNFNVGTPGLILNNFNGEVGTSNLGGVTPGNPNLKSSGPASVILNEVTSGNRSALNGPTEVFGGRADVIIANPNGITCAGCGFINTPHATLTTGVPNIGADGSLTGFTVNSGDVTFEGAGANLATAPGAVDLFDVVSRQIHVNAPVYGKTIRLTGGASQYNYATGEATALTATSGTPEYAIDGSALGAMQADRIKVVVTEKGAGVKMSGDMAANAGELSLSADGKISIGNASGRDGVSITSKRTVTAAKVTSKQKVAVQADQGITLQSIAADSDIVLASGAGLLSVSGDINSGTTVQMSSGGGIAAGNVTAGNGAATLVATSGDIAIAGAANSTGDLNLTATAGSISATSLLSNQNIALTAGLDIAVAGNVLAQGNVSATGRSVSTGLVVSGINIAATSADPSGNVVLGSAGNLSLTASGGNIATGNLLSAGTLNTTATGNMTAGSLQSTTDLTVTAASLTSSSLTSHGLLSVNAATNVSGQILGSSNILISGAAIQAGAIVSGVDFAATQAANGNLVLGNAGDMTLQSSGSLSANTLLAGGMISATSADLTVGNITGHQTIMLTGSSSLTTTGQVLGAGNVSLSGGMVSANQIVSGLDFAATEANGGNITLGAAGDLTLQASGTLTANALLSAGTITATAADLGLGSVTGHRDISLSGSNSLTATGQILGANNISLSGGTVSTGQVVTGVDFAAMAQSSTGAIVIGSAGDLTINATSATAGPLLVAGDLSVTGGSFTGSNVTGHGNVTVNAATNLTGTLLAAGNVGITGASITAGTLVSGVDFVATGQSADGSVVLGSTGGLTLKATAGNINAANLLSAGTTSVTASGSIGNSVATNAVAHQNLTMTAGGTIALTGQSMAAGNVSLEGQSISAGSLVSGVDFAATRASSTGALMLAQGNAQSGTMKLTATNGDITASNALLSGGNLSAVANGGISYALLQSLANASLTAPGTISYTNNSNVTGNLTIDTATIDLSGTRGAKLAVGGTLSVTATSANLTGGSLVLGGLALNLSGRADLTGAQVKTATNAGGAGDIAITAGSLAFSDSTTLLAAHDLTLTLPTLSNSGQIAAANNLTINTSGDLTNTSTGLLYAGNDASLLVAGTLTNNQGAILAGNDLTIAGSSLSQRNGATTNVSGLIQAGGDISILTSNLTNKRSTTPTWVTGQLISSGNVVGTFVLNPAVAGQPFAYLETSDQNIFQLYPGINPPAWQDYQPLLWSQATLADGTTYHAWTWTSANGPVLVGPIFDWIKARVPKDANGNPVLDPNNPSKYFIVDEVVRNGTDASTTYTWDPTANLSQSVYEDRFTSALSPEAVIRSGGNLTVDATNLTNSYSRIEAGANATLSGSTLTNEGVVLNRTTTLTCSAQSACTAYNADGTADPSRDIANGTSIVSGSQVIGGAAGTLKAVGALTLNFGTVNNSSLDSTGGSAAVTAPSTSSDPLSALSGLTAGGALFTVNSALSNVAGNSLPTAGGGLTAALGNLTQISPANVAQLAALAKPQSGGVGGTIPGQAFIFETRAAFLDVSKFYGSSYFINRAGYDPETNIPFLGDAYFDNQLIDTQLRQLVGDGLGNGSFIPGNSAIEQMKTLLDNGAAYAEAHGLAFGQGLTPEQAANLQQSIVIYQAQTVNGAQVMAPVVYLSAADRAKAGSSAGAMIAGNTVDLNVGDLNNSGAVAAAGGLNIAASSIKSTGTFYAGGNVNLTASNGITLAAQTMTIGGHNLVNPNAGVSAGGNIQLAANNSDLNLQGASVKAGGNAQLSGNNVTLGAVKADNGAQQNATGARVSAGGNLAIGATNDVNIIGSSAKSGGDLNVTATNGAVNIVSTDVARKTDDGYTKTSGTDQQASRLSAGGNLQVNANTGVLISGSDLSAKGDVGLTSNGDINVTTAQSQTASVFGKNSSSSITNNGSTITAGGDLVAKSNSDINVIGSTMAADGMLGLQAKNNVTIAEATDGYTLDVKSSSKKSGFLGSTQENASGHLENTTAAGSSLSGKAGTTIISGGDTTVSASKVTAGDATHTSGATTAGGRADINIQTGGNLIVTAGKDTETEHDSAKRKGFLHSGSASYDGYNETTVGSQLSASGDVNLDAGKAAAIVGSKVNADGSLNISGESVSIIGAQENHQSDSQRKDSGLFVGSGGGFISLYGKNEKQGQQSSTDNIGSTLSAGQDVNLTARATDLNIMGSSISADRDINLSAARDVNVTPGAESSSQAEQQKKSGFGLALSGGGGGFSIGIGVQSTKDSKAQQSDTNAISALSAGRDLNISAGHDVNLQATSASAERDVNLFAGNDINLLSANDVTNYQEAHEKTFAGVTLTVSSQVGKAAQSIMNSAERLSDSGGVNAVTNTAIAGLGFYQGFKDLQGVYDQYQKSGNIGVNVSLTVGANHQENSWSSSSSTPVVTDIRAGRSISMEAENGSITSDGAQILAGYDKNGIPTVSGDPLTGDIFLSAKNGDINLNAATGTTATSSNNSSWSAGIGVGATFGGGGKGTGNLGLVANAGYGKGSADASGVSHTNTHISGTGDITIITNDLTLRGATITGNSVTADVKNLTIESQVDTAKAKADQLNLSASTGFGSTSVSGVTQKAKGDAAVVTEQSGIHAGAGGLDINVSGQTSLVGGLITSDATADKNHFETGTLTVADIDTHSTWKADTFGGSIGTSGIMPTPPVKASENKTGQALSAIGGNIPITITDPAHQAQDIGTIRRDTENTNTSLPGLPDLEHILRDQYKTQADLQAAEATMAGLVGDIADGLRDRATTQAEQDFWAEGGGGRALLHAIGGGILGGVNGWEGAIKGALGGATTTLMAPAIASLVKGMLKDSTLSDQDKQTLANMIGTSLGSAVGGVVGGGEGASYGAANYQYNYLTHIQLEEAKKLASALAKCEGVIANCASYDALKQDLEAYRKLSAENTAALIRECSQGQSATCVSMMSDLKQFNEAVNAELLNMQNNPRGSSPQSNPTPNQVRYYEAVDGGLRLDYLVEQQFTTVLAGDQTPEQARRNIITTVVQSNKNLGQLNAILNGIGLVGSGVVIILSDGTALPIVAGGLGAASSGSHLYGDIQQGITGVVTEPGLVQLLKANDVSPANAVAIQNLIDLGAVITGLGVGLKPTLAKSASSLTSAERSLVDSGVLTLDEAAALPRTISTSDGQKITLPPGYKPIAGAGSAGNDVGGLPDGFVRVTDNKGNIVIAGPNGAIYADVATAQQAALATNAPRVIIDSKIDSQLAGRGWTKQEVQIAIDRGAVGVTTDNRTAAKTPDGLPRNDTASVYGSKSGYVVVNDRTGEVVQISGKNDPGWIPDSRIQWK